MQDTTHAKKKDDAHWRKTLTPEQYHVLREKGTEAAFSGDYWDNHKPGTYVCAGCGETLFSSEHKFDSGTGWPSFDRSVSSKSVGLQDDKSHGMERTEIICSNCGGHLGHLFNDGPKETTDKRFCINSAALSFTPKR